MENSAPFKEVDERPEAQELFRRLKEQLPQLVELWDKHTEMWGYEDAIYRFYHQSFKVYAFQQSTLTMVERLRALAPDRELNAWFIQIIGEGTGKTFSMSDNRRWLEATRPILEAFFHARFFLEMAVKSGRELSHPPNLLPSGWAALLYLYGLR